MSYRIFLSPPEAGARERELLLDAFDSNWIAPLGPHVDAFEREFATFTGVASAVALSSGTAALHLALVANGVGPGDRVLTSTLTFAATANAIAYVGAAPWFLDVDPATWTIDVDLLEQVLSDGARCNRPFKALMTVDLYGQCADYERVEALCREHGVLLIEDAAEAAGSSYRGVSAGRFGTCGAFSFNGNKIMTTSGGGMLVSDNRDLIQRVRHLATQAREPLPYYEHRAVGYNYRLSNLLAAVGRGQLEGLRIKVDRRRQIRERYASWFTDVPAVGMLREPEGCRSNCWLTCIQLDPVVTNPETVRLSLHDRGIEARPIWKPMHMQPIFAGAPRSGGDVAARIFARGLCLPSGSGMSDLDVDTVADIVRGHCE